MSVNKSYIDSLNHQLDQLNNKADLRSGLGVANEILRLLELEEIDPNKTIETVLEPPQH